MIDKILAFFGYKIIEINLYNKIKTEVEELGIKVSALEKDFAEKVSLFEKPGIEPEISFTDFQKALTTDNGYSPWQLYWKKYYAGAYLAWYLRQISLSPDFVANFLFKFSTFDWNGTATYMKQANWTWSNNKVTPSAQDLQQGVVSLLFLAIKDIQIGKPESTVESGGFLVTVKDNDLFIVFDKNSQAF